MTGYNGRMAKNTNDYKTMMAELQMLLMDMQSEGLDVDEAIAKYERGQKLITQLQDYLAVAENTVIKHKLQIREEIE